jgi:hypothetical protein
MRLFLLFVLAVAADWALGLPHQGLDLAIAPLIIPAVASVVGSIFKHFGDKKQQNQANEAQRAEHDRTAAARAARAKILAAVLKGYGLEGVIDPATMGTLTTPTPFSGAPSQNGMQGIGGFLSSIAPFMMKGGSTSVQAPGVPGLEGPPKPEPPLGTPGDDYSD